MMLIQHHKAAEFYDRCMDSFERLDREGERNARVMAIAVHPYISGTPFRIKYFEKVLDEVSNAGGAVMWTGSPGSWTGIERPSGLRPENRRRNDSPLLAGIMGDVAQDATFAFHAARTPSNAESL